MSLPTNSVPSPVSTSLHPSSIPICRLKSCRILMSASLSPGICRPFLIRRMSRMGSMSVDTFSNRPRMKVGRVSEYRSRSSQRSSSFRSLAKSIAYLRRTYELNGSTFSARDSYPIHVSKPVNNQEQSLLVIAHLAEQEHHLRDKVFFLTDCVCLQRSSSTLISRLSSGMAYLVGLIVGAGSQEAHQPLRGVLRIEFDLSVKPSAKSTQSTLIMANLLVRIRKAEMRIPLEKCVEV